VIEGGWKEGNWGENVGGDKKPLFSGCSQRTLKEWGESLPQGEKETEEKRTSSGKG